MNREALKDIFQNSFPEAAYAAAFPQWADGLRLIPEGMRSAVVRYVLFGSGGGHFLSALVSNDLRRTFERADLESRAAIGDYVVFFYNYAPTMCWGSEEKASEWRAKGGAFPPEKGEAL
jgi:hypothetical protein